MGFEYLHAHQNVNVITAANNIKRLLTLALANDSGLSMVVHPVGQSLLIDNFDIHKWLLDPSQSKPKWKWLRNFFFDKVLQGELHKAIVRKSHTNDALVERNLMSKFLYYSLPHDYSSQNNTLVFREHSSPAKTDEVTTHHDHQGPPSLPEPEEVLGPSQGPNLHNKDFGELRGHARNLLWNIQDIRMLIGSDMPIFGDSSHPTVSLRLHNVNKPINILTGLDYWLDNLMCQVPEVVMCFHSDGIVQKYEIFKTEDLPKFDRNNTFNEGEVMKVAKNILSFLRRNATKEGHTYWLFKSKNQDFVKLYDLTSLCEIMEEEAVDNAEENNDPNRNPFQDAVAMLLYKLGRNIMHKKRTLETNLKLGIQTEMNHFDEENEEASAKRALTNCLKLIDHQKYPQIAASAAYLLADILIPDDLNPLDPKFENCPESQKSPEQPKKKNKKSKRKQKKQQQQTNESHVSVEDLRHGEDLQDPEAVNPEAEKLPQDVHTRCSIALQHICDGLKSAQILKTKKLEMEEKQRKAREQVYRSTFSTQSQNSFILTRFFSQILKFLCDAKTPFSKMVILGYIEICIRRYFIAA